MARKTPRNSGKEAASGGSTVDTVARANATAAKTAVDALTASAGEAIIAGGDVFAASKLWHNGTASPINIPATVNDANMTAAGFTLGTGTVVRNEVVLSNSDLTGTAPAGALVGQNVVTGRTFHVASGNWAADVVAASTGGFTVAAAATTLKVGEYGSAAPAVNTTTVYTAPTAAANSWFGIVNTGAGTMEVLGTKLIGTGGAWWVSNAAGTGWVLASLASTNNTAVTGDFIGSAATFATLPTTSPTKTASNGDWAALSADDVGTGTAQAPQYPKGVYVYNGTAYAFAFALGGAGGEIQAAWAATTDANYSTPGMISWKRFFDEYSKDWKHYTSGETIDLATIHQAANGRNIRGFAGVSGVTINDGPGGLSTGADFHGYYMGNSTDGFLYFYIMAGPQNSTTENFRFRTGGSWGSWRSVTQNGWLLSGNNTQYMTGANIVMQDGHNIKIATGTDRSRPITVVPMTDWKNVGTVTCKNAWQSIASGALPKSGRIPVIIVAHPTEEVFYIYGQNPDLQGATATTAGIAGMAPAPLAGDQTKFLRADGTWAVASSSSFVVVKDVIDSTSQAKPTSDGLYSFSAVPSDGLPAGVALGDIARLSGTTWTVETASASAPEVVFSEESFSVTDATTDKRGIVQLASAADITAGTADRVVDAAQLKAATSASRVVAWASGVTVTYGELRSQYMSGAQCTFYSNSATARTTGATFDETELANWTIVGQAFTPPFDPPAIYAAGMRIMHDGAEYERLSTGRATEWKASEWTRLCPESEQSVPTVQAGLGTAVAVNTLAFPRNIHINSDEGAITWDVTATADGTYHYFMNVGADEGLVTITHAAGVFRRNGTASDTVTDGELTIAAGETWLVHVTNNAGNRYVNCTKVGISIAGSLTKNPVMQRIATQNLATPLALTVTPQNIPAGIELQSGDEIQFYFRAGLVRTTATVRVEANTVQWVNAENSTASVAINFDTLPSQSFDIATNAAGAAVLIGWVVRRDTPAFYAIPEGVSALTEHALTGSTTGTVYESFEIPVLIPLSPEVQLDTVTATGGTARIISSTYGVVSVKSSGGNVVLSHTTRPVSITDVSAYYLGTFENQAGNTGHTFTTQSNIGTGITTSDNITYTVSGGLYEVQVSIQRHQAYGSWRNTSLNVDGASVATMYSGHDGSNWPGGATITRVIDARTANKTISVVRAGSNGNGNASGTLFIRRLSSIVASSNNILLLPRNITGSATAQGYDNVPVPVQITLPAGQGLDTVTATGGATISNINRIAGTCLVTVNGADTVLSHTASANATYSGLQVVGSFSPPASTSYDGGAATVTTGIDFTRCDFIEITTENTTNNFRETAFAAVKIGGTAPGMYWGYGTGQMRGHIVDAAAARAGTISGLDCHGVAFYVIAIRGWANAANGYVVPTGTVVRTSVNVTANAGALTVNGAANATGFAGTSMRVTVPVAAGKVLASATATNGCTATIAAGATGSIELAIPQGTTGACDLTCTFVDAPPFVLAVANGGVPVTLGTIRVQMPSAGNRSMQIASATGAAISVTVSNYVPSVTGAAPAGTGLGSLNLDAAGTFQYARAYNFTAQGQVQTCMIRDTTNGFTYLVMMEVGAAFNNNVFSGYRLP